MTKETSQMIKEKYNDFLDEYNTRINESLKCLKENIEHLLKIYNFDKYVVYKDNGHIGKIIVTTKDNNINVEFYPLTKKGTVSKISERYVQIGSKYGGLDDYEPYEEK